jgi:hypothetical protein
MIESFSELVGREQAKRERNWEAKQRWRVIQDTITWAESQPTVRRNTKEACLANQQRLLEQIACFEIRAACRAHASDLNTVFASP